MFFLSEQFTPILPLTLDHPPVVVVVLGFIIGACLGSFAQAVALRLNRSEDFIRPASRCRLCDKRLSMIDNLPLIGWIKTLGFCRQCGGRFSVSYLLIEVIMGVLAAGLVWWFGMAIATLLIAAMTLMMICIITDLDKMLLHLPIMGGLGGLGFIISFLPFWPLSPLASLLGMVAVVACAGLINGIYMLARRTSGFGSGDFWLLGASGLWLGPVLGLWLFFLAAMLGACIGVAKIAGGTGGGQTALPFGVFVGIIFICWPILNILVILNVYQ